LATSPAGKRSAVTLAPAGRRRRADHQARSLFQALALSRDLGDPWSTAAALDVRAALAASAGRPDRAIRLMEAAAAVRDRAHMVQSPRERAWLRDRLRSAEQVLPRHRCAAERQAGRAMTRDQIFDLALAPDREDRSVGLTTREQEVARLLSMGWSDTRIADSLVISRRTAEAHVRNILAKLGLSSRAQIAVWAIDHGLRQTDHAQDREAAEVADAFT